MTDEEVAKLSTPHERWAEAKYNALQQEARDNNDTIGETGLLELSQVVGVLVERNKRLGLISKEDK